MLSEVSEEGGSDDGVLPDFDLGSFLAHRLGSGPRTPLPPRLRMVGAVPEIVPARARIHSKLSHSSQQGKQKPLGKSVTYRGVLIPAQVPHASALPGCATPRTNFVFYGMREGASSGLSDLGHELSESVFGLIQAGLRARRRRSPSRRPLIFRRVSRDCESASGRSICSR